MRHRLAALVLCLTSGGAAADHVMHVVEAPCFPEDEFKICAIPDVSGHAPGYIPPELPAKVALYPDGRRFVILVTPNVVPYAQAVRDAARAAIRYCGPAGPVAAPVMAGSPGYPQRVAARIDGRFRHSPTSLESWQFNGRCQ